jgi:hypothetical protein
VQYAVLSTPPPPVTVKVDPTLAIPFWFTMTRPVVAEFGTVAVILRADQVVITATTPLNLTVPVPCTALNPLPVITTEIAAAPDVGLSSVIAGVAGSI